MYSVPATCRFEVNRLLVPGETVESAVENMELLIEGLKLKSIVEVKTKPPTIRAMRLGGRSQ